MFKIEVAEGAHGGDATRSTTRPTPIAVVIGHEALCWLVRRGYAMVRGDYPAGTWTRD